MRKSLRVCSLITVFILLFIGYSSCSSQSTVELPSSNSTEPVSTSESLPAQPPPQENSSANLSSTDISPPLIDQEEDIPVTYSTSELMNLLEPMVVRIETFTGSGSGTLISNSGHIITNNHVVSESSLVKTSLMNGDSYDAYVLAREEARDLAILLIISDRSDYPFPILGSSNDISIGEDVVAIGYALGLEGTPTLSKGIVSAMRDIDGMSFIQTDAAITPGDSGGPLVNTEGKVIGINALKFIGEGVEGIGFAIPISEVNTFIQSVIK